MIVSIHLNGQTTIQIDLNSISTSNEADLRPGVFYVPKTTEAQLDFLNNGIHQNSIRVNIIESALNNTNNLVDCLTFLDGVSSILQELSQKTDKLIFIFEKMPVWLSSSSDGSPATTPGWYVLNTKPPANYMDWDQMVSSIVGRITSDYGIDNALFEIWNEPDLGSWTGTAEEYFELFQHTYDAIKSVNNSNLVGGPATNHWGKNLNFEPAYGYISNAIADSSLIGQLIDSTFVWNKPLDFISWHQFNMAHQTNQNAQNYIMQKYNSLGLTVPELIVSEWNTPSNVRDTPLQKSYFIANQIELLNTEISNHVVAAWQDFNPSTSEFHNDYGLITYGSIQKPVYNALLLSNKSNGNIVPFSANAPVDVVSTFSNDTVNVLISNYIPPAFVAALNHTLFEGQWNLTQLDSAGYIVNNNPAKLDSVFQELLIIPNTNSLNMAINNSIPIYQHVDSLQFESREFVLELTNLTGNTFGRQYIIDSTHNNFQFKYDSLINEGYTQNSAISEIRNNQNLVYTDMQIANGQLAFSMEPNSVQLIQINVSEFANLEKELNQPKIYIYPNPTFDKIHLQSEEPIEQIFITDCMGNMLEIQKTDNLQHTIDLSHFSSGIYYVSIPKFNIQRKIVLF